MVIQRSDYSSQSIALINHWRVNEPAGPMRCLELYKRKTDCNDTMQTDIWQQVCLHTFHALLCLQHEFESRSIFHFSVRWQKCISGTAGGISACESSLRARLLSSPCYDPHRQRNQSHPDSHYQIGFEAFFFFPIQQVNHLPFSEDRSLYVCRGTFKWLQAWLLLFYDSISEEYTEWMDE